MSDINHGSSIPAPKTGRQPDDFYKTPPHTTRALLAVERFSGPIHEPACGDGAISAVLNEAGHEVFSSDLVDRGFGMTGSDFLASHQRPCDTLITNPPFKLADEFALHALDLGYRHVALFARLAWLEGSARHRNLWNIYPPSRIWVFSKRQTLWRGDEEGRSSGGTLAFAWFVWQAGHHGTQMGWLT
jgi:hypothetical protein